MLTVEANAGVHSANASHILKRISAYVNTPATEKLAVAE